MNAVAAKAKKAGRQTLKMLGLQLPVGGPQLSGPASKESQQFPAVVGLVRSALAALAMLFRVGQKLCLVETGHFGCCSVVHHGVHAPCLC